MNRPKKRNKGVTIILLVLCLTLALLIAGEIKYGAQWREEKMADLAESVKSAQSVHIQEDIPKVDLNFPPLQQYTELVERPLFMSTRRPPEPEEEESVAQEEPPSASPKKLQATLTSVVITPQKRIALVTDHRNGQIVRLEHGSTLAGWHVELIIEDKVLLTQGGEIQELELWKYGKNDKLNRARSTARRLQARQVFPK